MLKLYDQDMNHIAVVEDKKEYTYGQLWSNISNICSFLKKNQMRRVAVIAHQGFDAYCVIWATYLSNGTFCCINADYPDLRQKECLELFEPDIVFCDTAFSGWENTLVIRMGQELECEDVPCFPDDASEVNDIAYVLFTSGSTGTPKGVKIRREALEQVIESAIDIFKLTSQDVGGQYSNISFDMGICDVFCMLSSGVKVVTIVGVGKLLPGRAIERYKITFWYSVPNVLDLMEKHGDLNETRLKSLRCIGFGGATLFQSHVERLFQYYPDLCIVNTYGPTEITIFSSAIRLYRDNFMNYCDGSVCLGETIAGIKQELQKCGDNLYEVIIYGDHVMEGYLFANQVSSKKFATGDLVRVKDGQIYFVSRNDSQVKINGNRIDLCEVDSILRKIGIENEIVLIVDERLIAIIEKGKEISESDLRQQIAKYLPVYCMPNRIIWIDAMPYNSNGKYDRKQLETLAREQLNIAD